MSHRRARARPQPAWMARVEIGSVLAPRAGRWRVVRSVTRYANGDLWGVDFAIRKRSWTNRCCTVVCYTDLIMRGFRLVGKVKSLDAPIDDAISLALTQPASERPYVLEAKDVVDVP